MIEIDFPALAFFNRLTDDGRMVRPPYLIGDWKLDGAWHRELPLPIMLADDNDYLGCVGALRYVAADRHGMWGWGEISAPEKLDDDKVYWPCIDLGDVEAECFMTRPPWRLRKVPRMDMHLWRLVGVTLTTSPTAWPQIPPARIIVHPTELTTGD